MTDASPTRTPQFCGNCGTPLVLNSKFCESCGTPVGAPQPASTLQPPTPPVPPQLAYSQQYYQPYPAPYAVSQLPRRSPLTRWMLIGVGVVVLIVLAIVAISALSGGGGSGPTPDDVAGSANFYHGSSQGLEILRQEKCKLTDLDRSRGYTKKWIVSYRKLNDDWIITDPFVYDGYQWDDYFAQNSNTGCPNIE